MMMDVVKQPRNDERLRSRGRPEAEGAHDNPAKMGEFLAYAVSNGLYPSADRLAHYGRWFFEGVQLSGADYLDVGCGNGLLLMYARLAGAVRSTGIEPEADGSGAGSLAQCLAMKKALRLEGVFAEAMCLEELADTGESYDVVSLCNVVNHLDEAAVVNLNHSAQARERYRSLLKCVSDLIRPGGTLILTDCGRRNLFAPLTRLGLRHPFEPTIEWHKHQEPSLWMGLLADVGFEQFRTSWRVPNRLRALKFLLSNGLAARCLSSEFRIVARR